MTYENAMQWAIDNVNMAMYDDYDDWINACQEEIATPELFREHEFMKLMEKAWQNEIGDITKSKSQIQEMEIAERQEALEQISMPQYVEQKPTRYEVEPEPPRQTPPTGNAPVITTRTYDMTPPKKESRLGRLRRFITRRKDK